jgi:hypothetical protein
LIIDKIKLLIEKQYTIEKGILLIIDIDKIRNLSKKQHTLERACFKMVWD